MSKPAWLMSTALVAFAAPALAQEGEAAPAPQNGTEIAEIVVTATRRSVALSDVPLAVSAVSGEALARSGVSDIRALNQLSPSLLVSSSQSEAAGGVARIRGVGTVGDNPGLESSVATFVDGVYRNRSGVALGELAAIERIEVLRGPQGTLFGRNASAGLINIITEKPSFTEAGEAEASFGNYDARRYRVGLTGPIGGKTAYRLDGLISKRDGFLKESDDYAGATGRRFNDRDRWMVRGQLLHEPSDALSVRLIADYAKRDEQCCAATFLPTRQVARSGGDIVTQPNAFAALERALGGVINDDPFGQRVSVTPGRDYRSDVEDWGVSAELGWDLGAAKLTSITAWRDWQLARATDADFTNLDILYRDAYRQRFRTFTQELRLQGKALGDRLDWLVGGYYADERLDLADNVRFGADYGLVQGCRIAGAISAAALAPGQAGCLNPLARPTIEASMGAFGAPLLSTLDRLAAISDDGATLDRFRQKDRTWALFTHNVIDVAPRVTLTLGARYTHDRKAMDATVESDTNVCLTQAATLSALSTQVAGALGGGLIDAATAAKLNTLIGGIRSLSCANNIGGGVDGQLADRVSDNEWSGTAVLGWKPTDRLLAYASYSRGYKAGGFNLDRAGLTPGAPNVTDLRFAAEKVDAFEVGLKYRGRGVRFAASGFYQLFHDFQLNAFNGLNFSVENIEGTGGKAGVVSKGVELEAGLSPTRYLSVDAGFTLADTRYRDTITGLDGAALPSTLFVLPGQRLSNAPLYTVTTGLTWTPPIGSHGLAALAHVDMRYQSEINTGSDLFPEKRQPGVAVVNARLGLTGAEQAWAIELWAQNLLDADYRQVVAGAPIQGSGTIAAVQAGAATSADSLFIVFPAEPRTWGLTLRTKF